MRLADRIAQCSTPFIVRNAKTGYLTHLNNAAAFSKEIAGCATRFVLSDELTRLCTALAYSKGAGSLACADLLHVPAERVWVEWTEAPWRSELARYGFKDSGESGRSGRRGVFIRSTPQGRGGLLRTFWTPEMPEADVLSSSMEAYFDFDTEESEEPEVFDREMPSRLCVSDIGAKADILLRCFRFRFERSWKKYYEEAHLAPAQSSALTHHALGTLAIDIPMVLAFFLLLITRPGLPRRPLMLERLNRVRAKLGKPALLDQMEVHSPILPEYQFEYGQASTGLRRRSRLHHVRGHLVRRGAKLFWRVPHLRGSAAAGAIRTRTVTWEFAATSQPECQNGLGGSHRARPRRSE
jgi:hypothetical protein